MTMKRISALALFSFLAAAPAWGQILPPTPQELQQQHDQAVQNESNNTHGNLNQTQQQIQQQAQQPTLNRSGRAVLHPPGYIPMPR